MLVAGLFAASAVFAFPILLTWSTVAQRLSLIQLSAKEAGIVIAEVWLLYVVAAWPITLPSRWQERLGTLAILSWFFLSIGLYVTWAYRWRFDRPALALPFAIVVCVFAVVGVVGALTAMTERQVMRRGAQFAVGYELITVQEHLSKLGRRFFEIEERRHIIWHLERAADIVTDFWPRRLNAANDHTRGVIRENTTRFAARINKLAQAVSWPAPETVQLLRDEIASILSSLISGDWRSLSHAQEVPSPQAQRRTWREVVVTAVSGVAPVALLSLLRVTGMKFPAAVEPWLVTGAYLWSLIAILAVLDPEIEKRLGLIRSALQLFKPGGPE